MISTIDLDGFSDLERQLASLDLVTQKKVLREVMRESAQPVLARTRSLYEQKWNHDTGLLGESIKLRVTIPRNPVFADVVASVGVFKSYKVQQAAGKYVEAPVYAYCASLKGHKDTAKANKRAHLRRSRPGQESLIHPGIPAGPFLRPGLDENVEKVLDVQKDHLGAAIDKAIR